MSSPDADTPEALLKEYKRYLRLDFAVAYGACALLPILGEFVGLALHQFESRFVAPRKSRISHIKRTLPTAFLKQAFRYFCIQYSSFVLLFPTMVALVFFVLGIRVSIGAAIALILVYLIIAFAGYAIAYYGLIERQELDSLLWSNAQHNKDIAKRATRNHRW